ncbi:MAG: hypothetical protein KAU58_04535, partial [Candidatus Omnitrophica bacterium]|nr:hypothetical protein [Candidatus Omnitrophota bacterium]
MWQQGETLVDITDEAINVEGTIETPTGAEEEQQPDTTTCLNSEVVQRKAIEEEIQIQASDPLFCGEMADGREEILPLQNVY